MTILAVVLALGLVVFLHEGGHFVLCRLVGIRVLQFAFGFGPEIVGFTRGATRYSICAFPLGGFVKPAGEDPEEMTGAPDEFFSKSWKARIAVALAGPAMNYLFSFVLFWFTFVAFGLPEMSKEAIVGTILSGSPAQEAGVVPGDRVLSIAVKGEQPKAITNWKEMAELIHSKPETFLILEIERKGEKSKVTIHSKKDSGSGIGLIGIAPQTVTIRVGIIEAVPLSLGQLYQWSFSNLYFIWKRIMAGQRVDLAGPIGIVSMMGSAVKNGWDSFLGLLAVISVAIGFLNLFPIPLLDGGHVAIYLWEGITRKKITREFLARANIVGLVILIPIFLFAMYNDLGRLWRSKATTEFQETIK